MTTATKPKRITQKMLDDQAARYQRELDQKDAVIARLNERHARLQIPQVHPSEYEMDCPVCRGVYNDVKGLIEQIHQRERSAFGIVGAGGMTLMGEHRRCAKCTILLGQGHFDSTEYLCESCQAYEGSN